MRLNKTLKNAAIALPLLVLAACSSNNEDGDQTNVETNANTEVTQDAITESKDSVQVTAAKRAAEIEEQKSKELAELQSKHIIYFDFDVSSVSSEYASILDAHAKFLSVNTEVKVLIAGHADERGTPEYNIALGERRAKAVVTYLENMGVSAQQLSVVSYGEEKPMIKDRSEGAFSKNRRAVLVY